MKFTLSLLLSCICTHAMAAKNVIIFIGDGMGYEQIRAGANYFHGTETLAFQGAPSQAVISTESYSHEITDSAASATAMATGHKTVNGYIGRSPETADVPNIFELAKLRQLKTGVVTSVSVSHATPAGFLAHKDHRSQLNGIVDSILSRSRPNLLLGAALEINPEWAAFKGYDVVTSETELMAYTPSQSKLLLSGQFGTYNIPWGFEERGGLPSLESMTQKAISLLSGSDEGFLLMVEGGMIDWGCHHENLYETVYEVREFEKAVNKALEFAANSPDTLVIITADHETGGLVLDSLQGQGNLPIHRWTGPNAGTGNVQHTNARIPLYAWGKDHQVFAGEYPNTQIFFKTAQVLLGQ